MAPELVRPVRRVTFVMMAVAAFAVEVAAADTRPLGTSLGLAAGWVVAAAVLAWLVPGPRTPVGPKAVPGWGVGALLVLGALPFLLEPLKRELTADGYPLELQMVFGLRNVGLGLVVLGGWPACLRLAGVVSLFLTLFAAAMTDHAAVLTLLGVYTTAGAVWLMMVYWTGLKSAFVNPAQTLSVEVLAERPRVPVAGAVVLFVALGGGLLLVLAGPRQAFVSLGELMPTSGGTGETDPFARYGVGDGPEEVAGDNAQTAGMVETDKMIEDNKNSLIDAVNDMYGPPHKPPKSQEKMVAAGKVEVIENHGTLPENRRPSRDFDTSRSGPKSARKPTSQDARGIFEVEGRTPLHVRVVAYDRIDADHKWVPSRQPVNRLIDTEGGDWMRDGHLGDPGPWYAARERHRLKSAAQRDNLVPTPAHLVRFRINKVDRPDYYEWNYEGVLALAGRMTTPPGVVVTAESETVRRGELTAGAFDPAGPQQTPDGLTPEVRARLAQLARDWAGGVPRGPRQIDAVLARLRSGHALDRAATPPADHPAPVLWFLDESKRGPDYLFATAAALLLRTLDYQARVCLGYYADPEAYDPETDHTPVRRTDLHTWAEVRLHDRHWLVVEPTPGYEVLSPVRTTLERIQDALLALWAFVRDNALPLAVLAVATAIVVWRRRVLADAALTQAYYWFPARDGGRQVRAAVTILERRARYADRARLPSQTRPTWLRQAQPGAAADDPDYRQFARFAEWVSYAPGGNLPCAPEEARTVCHRVVKSWPLARWQTPPPTPRPSPPS